MFGLFNKLRRGGVISHAAEELAKHLALVHGAKLLPGEFLGRLERDPYSAGYVDGKVFTFLMTALEQGANSQEDLGRDYGLAFGQTFVSLLGDEGANEYLALMRKHRNDKTPRYLAGRTRGQTITRYYIGSLDVHTDPDFARALQLGRKAENVASEVHGEGAPISDTAAALIGLEELWYLGVKS